MKFLMVVSFALVVAGFVGCDMRSDTAKREMEKFSGTPTPTRPPIPEETPIAEADIVRVETTEPGETISVLESKLKKSIACTKFNRIMVNGDDNVLTVKGACQRIMVNGKNNVVTGDAFAEIALNGDANTINYSRFVNGKRPLISDNGDGNSIDKVAAAKTAK